ncbi:AMP-binding protein [Psychrobium sp. MM17-31]|uniref:AMP-binding protein n=1 Tax=Psychrobium sp. MM17-31 TaxID=2917758 RepID=UPI001EF62D67|nr:AMP-binding protein [Psychrobium sp. MM17-31]MCG7532326.1 AMP-binding protein [Psychrobium sp. MM17-31]
MNEQTSLANHLEQALHKYADNPAYSCLGQTLTFAEIDEKSRALAAWLQHHPALSQGDRVVIQLPNITQYPIAAYAVLRAGMVIVNTNPLYTPTEMRHQYKDSGAKAVIILADLLPKLNEVISETDIGCVISTTPADLLTGAINDKSDGIVCFNQALAKGQELALQPRISEQPGDICILQYTGGTTGVSKGAMLTNSNVITNAKQTMLRLANGCREGQEIFVCPLPLYHIYAFTVNMVTFACNGNLNVLIPNPRDLSAFIDAIKPFKFTGMSGINTLFIGLCMQDAFKALDFSEFKLTISGGTSLTSVAAETWRKVTGCSISEGYGLSETSPVVCLNEPGNEVLGTVGKPLIETDVELRNEAGESVPFGDEGELVVRGPQVMKGYWQQAEETAKVFTEDGFFRTGDVAVRLATGEIKIVDRLKDMIIVSGFNVYPNEVEDVLTKHPNIVEAAVIGESDDKTGEKVAAFITVSSDIAENDIIEHCKLMLTNYKVPKKLVIMEELPKSTVGKILRRELRTAG